MTIFQSHYSSFNGILIYFSTIIINKIVPLSAKFRVKKNKNVIL